ncbi:hypothetical protein GUITHDRAFT_141982 [Guillardia theta CCMP2712]|uniref:Uncharacterized protein n=1 Tax=Guillardia theta (strain CCMP2712) TaxID=905079 RepID=L1J085_GUITC|nr:hypothetical protein GUITHDRAFT_141982 [Guillardia theta CCMP2712]EKX41500.1 hypothetical protein GUITHDRAFT_141982 [Guillardia theta CCMP2712]|eukprot:XP_005828480.1 hypothetical protein GUITHDRAFT_141982 [Guillardia theta CCMP2712]
MPFATNGLDGLVSFAAGVASSAAVMAAVNYVHNKQDEDCKKSIKQRLSSRIRKVMEERNGQVRVIEILIDEREHLHGLLKERRNEISALKEELADVTQQRTTWWERYIDAASTVKDLVPRLTRRNEVDVHGSASMGVQADIAAHRRANESSMSSVQTMDQSSQTERDGTCSAPASNEKLCVVPHPVKISCQKEKARARAHRGSSQVSSCKNKIGCPRRCSRRPADSFDVAKVSIPSSPSCKGVREHNALALHRRLSSAGKPGQEMLPILDDMLQGSFGLGLEVVEHETLGLWSWLSALSVQRGWMRLDLDVAWMPSICCPDQPLQADGAFEGCSSSWRSKAMLLLGTALAVHGAMGGARDGGSGLARRGRDTCFMPRRSQLEARLMRLGSNTGSTEAALRAEGLVKETKASSGRERTMKLASLLL